MMNTSKSVYTIYGLPNLTDFIRTGTPCWAVFAQVVAKLKGQPCSIYHLLFHFSATFLNTVLSPCTFLFSQTEQKIVIFFRKVNFFLDHLVSFD